MSDTFGKAYWDSHWQQGGERDGHRWVAPSPYLDRELTGSPPGAALDAGCGEGAEAMWLAAHGWRVTGVDISAEALSRAAAHADAADVRVEWVEADLTLWQPNGLFDLVTTFYAHPTMPQVEFYERIATSVAPGGTLLIVGHLGSAAHPHAHGAGPILEASVTAETVTAVLEPARWRVDTAEEVGRLLSDREGRPVSLQDVVVRATRLSAP